MTIFTELNPQYQEKKHTQMKEPSNQPMMRPVEEGTIELEASMELFVIWCELCFLYQITSCHN